MAHVDEVPFTNETPALILICIQLFMSFVILVLSCVTVYSVMKMKDIK